MDPSRANQSMDDSSSSYGDSIFSSRSPSSSNTSIIPPGPPRGDEIDRWQRHIGMQDFAKDLQIAAESVYPNHKRSRYSNVYVLIFKWKTEDPKLPVWYEIEELYHVLDQIYGYEIEIFEIPDHKSHAKVVEKVTAFIAINDDSKNDLKIVYYAGHSRLSDTRDLVWSRCVVFSLYEKEAIRILFPFSLWKVLMLSLVGRIAYIVNALQSHIRVFSTRSSRLKVMSLFSWTPALRGLVTEAKAME
jgi:hypothetical protein